MPVESQTDKPLILLSNDDGYASLGIRAMHMALREAGAHVVLVAPEVEQSAASHALSLHNPLRLRRLDDDTFAIDGTPADCVYVALHAGTRVLKRRPDLVVSGINRGLNLGQDAFYSGTVAAAREGALRGVPSLAVSAEAKGDLARVSEAAASLAFALLDASRAGTLSARLFNFNVPTKWTGEVRATRLGARIYDESVDFRRDPRGREYLWLGGPNVRHDPDPGSDTDAFDQGVASLTPLVLDLTLHSSEANDLATLLATHASDNTKH
jgi:5'-nucleotidase